MKNNKKTVKNNNKKLIIIICILLICIISLIIINKSIKEDEQVFLEPTQYNEKDFNLKLIKTVNSSVDKQNYLISPYSIEYSLNMLREATANNSLKEIDEVAPKREIPDLNLGKKIGVANGLFIKETYKDSVSKEFSNKLKEEYNSEILYDKFQTPKVINDWVDSKTNHLIPKLLDDIGKDFIFGIANALAIDVEWEIPFDPNNTKKENFTLENGKKIKTEMMHNIYKNRIKYFKDNHREGVIIPYKTEKDDKYALELILLMPNNSISEYIENLKDTDLNISEDSIDNSKNLQVELSLPKFEYDFDLKNFMTILKTMGIKDVFDSSKADLSKALSSTDAYVSKAVHKTKIKLNEKGTEAAATTYYGTRKNAVYEEKQKIVKIDFNKPFIYIIRERNTKELLFFGSLYNPQ